MRQLCGFSASGSAASIQLYFQYGLGSGAGVVCRGSVVRISIVLLMFGVVERIVSLIYYMYIYILLSLRNSPWLVLSENQAPGWFFKIRVGGLCLLRKTNITTPKYEFQVSRTASNIWKIGISTQKFEVVPISGLIKPLRALIVPQGAYKALKGLIEPLRAL